MLLNGFEFDPNDWSNLGRFCVKVEQAIVKEPFVLAACCNKAGPALVVVLQRVA